MGATAPDSVKRLVDRFDQDRKVFQSPDHKEGQFRAEFLNPFFESLGWDVSNKAASPRSSNRSPAKSQSRLVLSGVEGSRARPRPRTSVTPLTADSLRLTATGISDCRLWIAD